MHDLVIRGGTIVDGTGAAPREGDVAIDGGKIAAVGRVAERGREEIDARGKLVTPGFVDIHTHYDGQATWDPLLTPSCWHGVTTLVMGNCGVGFAPVRPGEAGLPDRPDGRRRGHPGHGAARGHPLELGDLPAVPRRARPRPLRARHRHAGAARPGARLRDGRARREERARDAGRHRADGGDREGGDRGRRARLLDVAHDRAPRRRRRGGARHVRRRGRALRHRPRARRARPRPLRARARRRDGRGPRGAREGGRLDAPALRGDGPPGLVRALAARRRQRAVEAGARAVPRREQAGSNCGRRSARGRPCC